MIVTTEAQTGSRRLPSSRAPAIRTRTATSSATACGSSTSRKGADPHRTGRPCGLHAGPAKGDTPRVPIPDTTA